MKVEYLKTIELPEFLAGQEGAIVDHDPELGNHLLRLWGEGMIRLIEPPPGFSELSAAGEATARAKAKAKKPMPPKKPAAPTP